MLEKNADKFPTPSGLFTIDEFGGWGKVADPFFGDDGWVIKAEADLGNPTELGSESAAWHQPTQLSPGRRGRAFGPPSAARRSLAARRRCGSA